MSPWAGESRGVGGLGACYGVKSEGCWIILPEPHPLRVVL